MKRELVYMDAKSSKFWNIECDGSEHTVTYGRIGTPGQVKSKSFDSEEKALAAFEKLVRAKMSKGYVDAQGSGVVGQDEAGADGDKLPLISFVSINRQDDIFKNCSTFIGKRVVDYNPDKGPKPDGKTIYRFLSDWESEGACEKNLTHFLKRDAALECTGIVIGAWHGDDSEGTPDKVIEILVENKDRLPKLLGLYLGDITQEENEMSWIQQTDVSPLLKAFPSLQLLRTRGGENLALKEPEHAKLRALALETGGMSNSVVRSVCMSNFPELEHLELWLGTEEYGGSCSVQDLQPILSGSLFPKLKYLGFRNCDFVDDIAGVIVNSPIIHRIETLDLSLGTLSDVGAKALLSLPTEGSLKKLGIHHHYVDAKLVRELKSLAITVDASNPENMEDDDEWRFVAVGE